MNYRSLMVESASLLSEQGENPEYDRALAEVVTFMGGGTSDDVHLTMELLRDIKNLAVNHRSCRLAWLPRTLELMSEEEYVRTLGQLCPRCEGTVLLESEDLQHDSNRITQQCECDDCGLELEDRYELTGYRIIEDHDA